VRSFTLGTCAFAHYFAAPDAFGTSWMLSPAAARFTEVSAPGPATRRKGDKNRKDLEKTAVQPPSTKSLSPSVTPPSAMLVLQEPVDDTPSPLKHRISSAIAQPLEAKSPHSPPQALPRSRAISPSAVAPHSEEERSRLWLLQGGIGRAPWDFSPAIRESGIQRLQKARSPQSVHDATSPKTGNGEGGNAEAIFRNLCPSSPPASPLLQTSSELTALYESPADVMKRAAAATPARSRADQMHAMAALSQPKSRAQPSAATTLAFSADSLALPAPAITDHTPQPRSAANTPPLASIRLEDVAKARHFVSSVPSSPLATSEPVARSADRSPAPKHYAAPDGPARIHPTIQEQVQIKVVQSQLDEILENVREKQFELEAAEKQMNQLADLIVHADAANELFGTELQELEKAHMGVSNQIADMSATVVQMEKLRDVGISVRTCERC
jgi:hypothetical protein